MKKLSLIAVATLSAMTMAEAAYINLPSFQPFPTDLEHGEYITGNTYSGVTTTVSSNGSTNEVQAYWGDQLTGPPDMLGFEGLGIVIAENPHTTSTYSSTTGITKIFGPVSSEPTGGTITFDLDFLARSIIFDVVDHDLDETLVIKLYRDGEQVGPTFTPNPHGDGTVKQATIDLTPWYATVFDQARVTIDGDAGFGDFHIQPVVPEPSTALLGLLGLPLLARRKR